MMLGWQGPTDAHHAPDNGTRLGQVMLMMHAWVRHHNWSADAHDARLGGTLVRDTCQLMLMMVAWQGPTDAHDARRSLGGTLVPTTGQLLLMMLAWQGPTDAHDVRLMLMMLAWEGASDAHDARLGAVGQFPTTAQRTLCS